MRRSADRTTIVTHLWLRCSIRGGKGDKAEGVQVLLFASDWASEVKIEHLQRGPYNAWVVVRQMMMKVLNKNALPLFVIVQLDSVSAGIIQDAAH